MLTVLGGTISALGQGTGASIDVQIDVAGTVLLARVTRKSVAALALAPGRPVYVLVKAVAIDRHSVGWA
jgi:molybdate transport system ATP-binding protein